MSAPATVSPVTRASCPDPLLAWRKEFPILTHTTYMVSHSLGAMPRGAADAAAEFTETWATRGVRAWEEGWWEMPVTVGNLIAAIIGAGPGEVGMQQNVSICQWIVTSCFDWHSPRNKLVTDGLNFPSNDYIYYGLERQGARIVSVPSPDGMTLPLDDLLAAIDHETQLVSLSHVAFRSSYVQDLAAVIERAHAVGALVIADLYQSAGILPVDVTRAPRRFRHGRLRQVALRRGPERAIFMSAPTSSRHVSSQSPPAGSRARASVRLRQSVPHPTIAPGA